MVKYEAPAAPSSSSAQASSEARPQPGLTAHVDGPPWSFVVALNDADNFTGGGTRFLRDNATYRPNKAGSAVLFSGKNRHEGVPISSGTRYILTGFCEYVQEHDFGLEDGDSDAGDCGEGDGSICRTACEVPHAAFMADPSYDTKYDGFAAEGGVRTGDVVRGVYMTCPPDGDRSVGGDFSGCVVGEEVCRMVDEEGGSSCSSDLQALLNRAGCSSSSGNAGADGAGKRKKQRKQHQGKRQGDGQGQWSLLVERLVRVDRRILEEGDGSADADDVEDKDKEKDKDNNGDVDDVASAVGAVSCCDPHADDRALWDVMCNVDMLLSVGEFWKFDGEV